MSSRFGADWTFDAADPFPVWKGEDSSLRGAAGEHASEADRWLGLPVDEIEAQLLASRGRSGAPGAERGAQHWIGTASRIFQTPYVELRGLLDFLSPGAGQRVVDLGAAYGRLGFVLARYFADVSFLGYEAVPERVAAGAEALARVFPGARARLVVADLSLPDFVPERADFYFMYDYGTREAIEKTLCDLREIARGGPICVVGRGRASRDAIERGHPWLSVRDPRHFPGYSVYWS